MENKHTLLGVFVVCRHGILLTMKIHKNIGSCDQNIRVVVGLLAFPLGLSVSAWFFVVSAIALITAAVGWCGLYTLVGVNTCPSKDR